MKQITLLMIAGALSLGPSLAGAFEGNLVTCHPTVGVEATAELKPGLDCNETKNRLKVAALLDGCSSNSGAPWDTWAAGKVNSKISSTNAALISRVTISLKGVGFSSCLLGGTSLSSASAAAAKLTFFDASGVNKVKGGKGQAFGEISGDLATQEAVFEGFMTKGFGAGAQIRVVVGVDVTDPINSTLVTCNAGSLCPPDIDTRIEEIALITTASSLVRIDFRNNADCVGNNDPYSCCTGSGTGNC